MKSFKTILIFTILVLPFNYALIGAVENQPILLRTLVFVYLLIVNFILLTGTVALKEAWKTADEGPY